MSYKGFSSVELRRPKRSVFDLSHERRVSTRMGKLTPIFITETMPNDTFKGSSELMLRLAPLIAPIMHRVNVYVHFFFIPNRLLWEDWENFITGGRLGETIEEPPVPPQFSVEQALIVGEDLLDAGSLGDYMGIPPIADADSALWAGTAFDLMPFAAAYKVWYDYYRDRNYHADNDLLPLTSGNQDLEDITPLLQIKYRCWEHDYFTSSLPFTQRGEEVTLPVSTLVTTVYKKGAGNDYTELNTTSGAWSLDNAGHMLNSTPVEVGIRGEGVSVTINELRAAERLQEWMERQALGGSRYNETIYAHFGRRTSDARLQMAEYLGGGKVAVKISEVVTTAFSEDSDTNVVPPANMAGHGLTFGDTNSFSYNCEEHGFIIGFMSIMPTSGYKQGIPRMFFDRNTFLSYPWPAFAHLGEQPVYKYELYASPTNLPSDRSTAPVFGYNSRYIDWKNIPSSDHGDFRSSLEFWTLTRTFASSPTLGETFVTFEDALQDRVFAVSGVDTCWCYIYNAVKVTRSLPYFGTPTL